MKTLIELYDERPIENVLSSEVFRPETTVFICPPNVASNAHLQNHLRQYFRHRGLRNKCKFIPASIYDVASVEKNLREVLNRYPDCALDIAGGSESALFAGGRLCASWDIPVFTYSSKRNCFFNIQNAEFAHNRPCTVELRVEDCFLMAGGAMREGRVDNRILHRYMHLFDPFFRVFMEHRRIWTKAITYIQRISQKDPGSLHAEGGITEKGEHGRRVSVPRELLKSLEKLDMIRNLSITEERVSFDFADAWIRTWLRDVGSVLELYIYKVCLDSGVFKDVVTSAVVDWLGEESGHSNITNELDVMGTSGVRSAFISCKTCEAKTEALNELAILRDRFGGRMASAAIVTAENGSSAMLHRATELGIDVIDLRDLRNPDVMRERIRALMR
ncbi:MAG: DUF1887 family protein [Clostridia bacterium]|nr:DUF1887 family protein [Clostridia bacterium]